MDVVRCGEGRDGCGELGEAVAHYVGRGLLPL